MKMRNVIAAAIGLLSLVSCVFGASSTAAQAGGVAPALALEPVFALRVDPALVPMLALRRALEGELGVSVADVALATPSIPIITVTQLPTGNIEVALTSRSLPRATREVALPAQRPEERVESIALIAANLVRNEAATLLPDLLPATRAPTAAAAVSVPARLPSPCDATGEPATFGFDFAPGVGSSSTRGGREATRSVALGLGGTLSARLRGFALSFGANIQRVSVCGVQLAIGANISRGPMQGLQYAAFNLAHDVVGVQAGMINVDVGDGRGLQASLLGITIGSFAGVQGAIANYAGNDLRGLQYGAANYAGGDLQGIQGGVVNVIVGTTKGLQGGVLNVAVGDLQGVQAAVANVAVGHLQGLQVGVGNYAGSTHGPQLGVANVSEGYVDGVQLGLFNYAGRSRASIGLLSIVRNGRTSIDALVSVENATMMAGITHGSQYVHNSYAVGVRTKGDTSRAIVSYALGVRPFSSSFLRVDIDAFSQLYLSTDMANRNTSVSGLRVPVTAMLVRGFGVVVAPSYQVLVTDEPNVFTKSAFGDTRLHENSDRRVMGYPGLTLGLRYEFDHGA